VGGGGCWSRSHASTRRRQCSEADGESRECRRLRCVRGAATLNRVHASRIWLVSQHLRALSAASGRATGSGDRRQAAETQAGGRTLAEAMTTRPVEGRGGGGARLARHPDRGGHVHSTIPAGDDACERLTAIGVATAVPTGDRTAGLRGSPPPPPRFARLPPPPTRHLPRCAKRTKRTQTQDPPHLAGTTPATCPGGRPNPPPRKMGQPPGTPMGPPRRACRPAHPQLWRERAPATDFADRSWPHSAGLYSARRSGMAS